MKRDFVTLSIQKSRTASLTSIQSLADIANQVTTGQKMAVVLKYRSEIAGRHVMRHTVSYAAPELKHVMDNAIPIISARVEIVSYAESMAVERFVQSANQGLL